MIWIYITIFFVDWGTHEDDVKLPYLTVAATIGLTTTEIDIFIKKLRECFKDLMSQKYNTNK